MLQLCLENILDIFVSQQIFKKICIDITEKKYLQSNRGNFQTH